MSFFLHRDHESIYVDLNIIFNTDLFVVDKIYRYLFRTNDSSDVFYRLKEMVESHPDGYGSLPKLVQNKKHSNPLMDYMEVPNKEIADAYYNGILFDDDLKLDDLSINLPKTSLGQAFTTLLKDTNLDHLYIYSGNITEPLFSFIYSNLTEINKIDIIVGEREGFLTDVICDNYFFDDIKSMNILLDNNYVLMSSVYCPEYVYNMRKDIPHLVNSPKGVDILEKENNLTVNTIKIPF